jgi:endonuclease YncB( thermonuclease family)
MLLGRSRLRPEARHRRRRVAPRVWDADLALGERAKDRLRELVATGPVRLAVDEGHTARWGRGLATLTVAGRDVGKTLINEGLSVACSG